MSTGRALAIFLATTSWTLGGCTASEPRAILSAGELEAMIQVEVRPIEPAPADDTVVAALQP
jgi:hypothetical protein